MATKVSNPVENDFAQQLREWIEAFDDVVVAEGPEQGGELLTALKQRAREAGISQASELTTPYVNTIPKHEEVPYPGDRKLERRIEALIRWNAMAMVHGQNKKDHGIGGHIATYSSLATLLEVGFNHFFHAKYGESAGRLRLFPGTREPGHLCARVSAGAAGRAAHSEFPARAARHAGAVVVSASVADAGFLALPDGVDGHRAAERGVSGAIHEVPGEPRADREDPAQDVGVCGRWRDGRSGYAGRALAGRREKLDNLIFVVNCNLQRLDGPVRGNGRIIDELEAVFLGAGWNVIKVIWGSDWDELFERDHTGLLLKRMEECVDGEYQAFKAKDGAYIRKDFFGKYPELLELVEHMTDDEFFHLHRGGHDARKIYNAYKRAVEHKGGPTVILAKTVKGYGLGSTQARNASHQEKKVADDALVDFIRRYDLPIPEADARAGKLYVPPQDAPEMAYMHARRQGLGGFMPKRDVPKIDFKAPKLETFAEWTAGSKGRAVSTTMGFVSILRALMKDPKIGKLIVPIVPDEGRTFGLESAIKQVGIYASEGQKYKPHDVDMLLSYREEKDGQILEEGITEAGSMASFTAAGTGYSNYLVPTIPFYMYYSMFGFQRVGDMMWAFADARGKGFLMAGTAGRTTMTGEGLQHQDGHSHLLMSVIPTCVSYDPAYVYELAVILQRRHEADVREGRGRLLLHHDVQRGLRDAGDAEGCGGRHCARHLQVEGGGERQGGGAAVRERADSERGAAGAGDSGGEVRRGDGCVERDQLQRAAARGAGRGALEPAASGRSGEDAVHRVGAGKAKGPIIAATDYMKALPDQLAPWLTTRLVSLGTDGFGRSDNREHLRRHFEVNAESVVAATLSKLARDGKFDAKKAQKAMAELGVDAERGDPAHM